MVGDSVKSAKCSLEIALADDHNVAGVGLTRLQDGRPAIVVLVYDKEAAASLPDRVDDVLVIVRRTGPATAH